MSTELQGILFLMRLQLTVSYNPNSTHNPNSLSLGLLSVSRMLTRHFFSLSIVLHSSISCILNINITLLWETESETLIRQNRVIHSSRLSSENLVMLVQAIHWVSLEQTLLEFCLSQMSKTHLKQTLCLNFTHSLERLVTELSAWHLLGWKTNRVHNPTTREDKKADIIQFELNRLERLIYPGFPLFYENPQDTYLLFSYNLRLGLLNKPDLTRPENKGSGLTRKSILPTGSASDPTWPNPPNSNPKSIPKINRYFNPTDFFNVIYFINTIPVVLML